MDGTVNIRTASEADFDVLTDLWERSARSSHAFMADEEFVELLYIAPEAQGHGVGPQLLAQLADGHGPRSVEVYADNSVGLGFYLSQGFREARRDPTDGAGRAFAIVHLERVNT